MTTKNKKTKWHCIDCGYSETSHKFMDGFHCPKCGGNHFIGELVKKNANA